MNFSPAGGLAGTIIFAIVMVTAFVIFGLEVRRLIAMMLLGRPENRFDHMGQRVGHFASMVLGQRGVLRDPIPGVAHFFTFWGFIIISLGTLNLWFGAFNGAIPVLGGNPGLQRLRRRLYAPGVSGYRRLLGPALCRPPQAA